MKAAELRIGNFIDTTNRGGEVHLPNHHPLRISRIEFFKILAMEPKDYPAFSEIQYEIDTVDISPILLTDEWLEGFGFKRGLCQYIKLNPGKWLEVAFNDKLSLTHCFLRQEKEEGEDGFVLLTEHIKCVHQLQNLYFALTEMELSIKEEAKCK